MISVERLRRPPAEVLGSLVADSEADGLRFVRRLVEEWKSGVNRFEEPGEALFVARRASTVIGACGLNIDPYVSTPRDMSVGRVRHLYVLSTERRLGVGERLLTEVMATARATFDRLHLRTSSPAAARLYERVGFRRCGLDPHCTHIIELDRLAGAAP